MSLKEKPGVRWIWGMIGRLANTELVRFVNNTQALCSPIYLSSLKVKMASNGELLRVLCV